MTAPIDLGILKDDLNITSDDHDDWLQRRVDAIWSRIESYTGRSLNAPPATFRDDWSTVMSPGLYITPPVCRPVTERASVFLQQFPVVEVTAIEISGEAGESDNVIVEKASGRILSIDGTEHSDVGAALFSGRVAITYTAGWEEIPPELYDVVLALMTPLWAARSASASGTLTGVSSISITDVGSVDVTTSTAFADVAAKSGGDPMLGPYQAVLSPYVDWRSKLGGSGFVQSSERVEEAGS